MSSRDIPGRKRCVAANLLLLSGLALFVHWPVFATQSVTLKWNPSTDPTVVGYNIYYGGSSGNYTNTLSAGDATNLTVSGLVGGTVYYFAATTYNSSGAQSPFSTEVSYSVPTNTVTVNQPPTLDPINNLRINTNAGPQTVYLSGITSGAANENQKLMVTATSSNTNLVPNPTVIYTDPDTNGSLILTPTTDATGSATVSVTVNDGGASNNTVTQTFMVWVKPVERFLFLGLPSIATQPTDQVVKMGGDTSFTVVAGGTSPLSYQWNFGGMDISGATNTTLTLNDIQLVQAGNYAVLVTNRYGSILSSNAVLTVGAPPVIVTQPAREAVALLCDAKFNVSASGTEPLGYQWWKDGLALNGQTSLSLAISNVQTSDFGSYLLVATNSFGSITSSPAQLALGHPPVASPDTVYRFAAGGVRVNARDLLANDTDVDGDSLTITRVSPASAAGGTVGLTNNWVYYAPSGGSTNGDTFTCIASDGHCGTDVGTVTVHIKADNPQPLSFGIACPGDGSIQLTFDGIPGYAYRIEYTDRMFEPDWQTLTTQTADGLGVCRFEKGIPTNAPVQFYRAVWP